MAVPARRVSSARRDKRRNNVQHKLSAPAIVKCPNCGEFARSHRLCAACGYYNGKQIVEVAD